MQVVINGEPHALAAGSTVATMLSQLNATGSNNTGRRVAVERNGVIVPRSQHAHTPLHDGDVIEVVIAVCGG